MNDRGIIASNLLSRLSKITNTENTSQFKLVEDPNSNRVKKFLINKSVSVFLYNKLLTFRDIDKKFNLTRDLLKIMTNKNYNVDLANSSDEKLMYDFAKALYFDEKVPGKKITRDS